MIELTRLNAGQFKAFLDQSHVKNLSSAFAIAYSDDLYLEHGSHAYRLNNVVRSYESLAATNGRVDRSVIAKIRSLEQEAWSHAQSRGLVMKVATAIRERVGSFFYDRDAALDRLEFPEKTLATSKKPFRLLLLNGEQGAVTCRVRGECAATIPHISKGGVIEAATRSYLRMVNLIAVRGENIGARMIGPCDYFGNVEAPYKHNYTIDIDEAGVPAFLLADNEPASDAQHANKRDPQPFTTTVAASWHKGTDNNIQEIQNSYRDENKPVLGRSLFPNAGILEIGGSDSIVLKRFDARTVDLRPFKARLVNNQIPFKVTSEVTDSSDDYRAVTYLYEPNYADEQVRNGGGLFLETHGFAQTMTPIDQNARGFVTLGRWADAARTRLELLGVEIPFGYTLIIERDCIHGDTNLSGMFMMCMTSSHVTMRTADTTFLKSVATRKNISISIEGQSSITLSDRKISPLLQPLAISRYAEDEEKRAFKETASKMGLIFNPLQRI